jgi:hypothetical protein
MAVGRQVFEPVQSASLANDFKIANVRIGMV